MIVPSGTGPLPERPPRPARNDQRTLISASGTRMLSYERSGPTRNDHRRPRHRHRPTVTAHRRTRERDAGAVVRALRSHSERSPHSATPSPPPRPSAHARAGRGGCRTSAQVPLGTITADRDTATATPPIGPRASVTRALSYERSGPTRNDHRTPRHRHRHTATSPLASVTRSLSRERSRPTRNDHHHTATATPTATLASATGAPPTSVHVPLGAISGPHTRRRRCPTGKGSAVVGRSRGARAAPRRARKEIRPRGSRRAWPATTCGWRPGSCG